ncbi:MAG TPA: VWA domain-containing protein [Opitutaceae bacterium]|nr:VWA domain-containing protein [Opitutaceae bacterium]
MKRSTHSRYSAVALLSAMSLAACSAQSLDTSVRLRIELDRTVLPAETPDRAIVKICLDGLRLPRPDLRPPVNLALVIDRSGSMSGEKIEKAKEAALEVLRHLSSDDVFSLVAYESGVQTLIPARPVGNGRAIERAIRSIRPGGNTALFAGVSQGASEVRKYFESGYVNRIVLLSDGLANVGPSSPEELGRLGSALLKEGISVTTVGLGLDYNEDLMTRLAQRSDGNTYFVESSADLPRIFAAELGDVLNVVARRVVIEIEFPAGVRPLRFVGREGVIRGQHAELTLNQLYGGQEKYALVEIEVVPPESGAECEIARARVSYEDALTRRNATLTAARTVQFSRSRSVVISSADHQVQADYAQNVIALAKDKAVELVDSGRQDEAAQEMRRQAEALQKLADTYGNVSVSAAAATMPAEAEKLERDGLDNAARKSYRAESSQVRSQQASR